MIPFRSFQPEHPLLVSDKSRTRIDLSATNQELNGVDFENAAEFHAYIFEKKLKHNTLIGLGGYAEDRVIYLKRAHFGESESDIRTIHLGLDIWTDGGTAIYAPWEGTVHSFRDNRHHGDYGPTIILEHVIKDQCFYALYGHLSRSSLVNVEINRKFGPGEVIGKTGVYDENGHWPPHLHFQLILDIGTHNGDYPGVCSKQDADRYLKNCPDPSFVMS